jgi:glyoxylase-like metal-dependent hydrolase (beta-lactamase superfamily II)
VSNAGVVVDDDGLTIIDTLMVRSQWEPFAAAVAGLDLPVKRVLLTHAHIDHVGGTQAFLCRDGARLSGNRLSISRCPSARTRLHAPFAEEFDDLAEARNPSGRSHHRRRHAAHRASSCSRRRHRPVT